MIGPHIVTIFKDTLGTIIVTQRMSLQPIITDCNFFEGVFQNCTNVNRYEFVDKKRLCTLYDILFMCQFVVYFAVFIMFCFKGKMNLDNIH